MGFFGSGDKSTSTTSSQVGASDDALLINTGVASVNKFGSSEVIGSTLNSNSVLAANSGTITYGLGVEDVTKLLSDTTSGISALVNKQTDAARNQVQDVVTGLQDLAMSKQTDGESNRDKTILWIVGLGLIGVLAFIFGGKSSG